MFISATISFAIDFWSSLVGTQAVVFPDLLTNALNNKINGTTVFAAVLSRINVRNFDFYYCNPRLIPMKIVLLGGRRRRLEGLGYLGPTEASDDPPCYPISRKSWYVLSPPPSTCFLISEHQPLPQRTSPSACQSFCTVTTLIMTARPNSGSDP